MKKQTKNEADKQLIEATKKMKEYGKIINDAQKVLNILGKTNNDRIKAEILLKEKYGEEKGKHLLNVFDNFFENK